MFIYGENTKGRKVLPKGRMFYLSYLTYTMQEEFQAL